jgi:ferredoxin-like protein FixX
LYTACFAVDSKRHKAVIVAGHEWVQCGACTVQCPDDAPVFTYPDGRTIPWAVKNSWSARPLAKE